MNNKLDNLKEQMCEIGRRIWLRGYCAGNEGNHSVRIDDDRYLCTPTGLSKGFLTPDDIVVVNGKGEQIEKNKNGRKRTSEVLVHLAIYKQRPDINAVIHSHPPHAVAFCIAGMPLPEGIHPEAEVFLGKVPVAPYATPGTDALPNSILPLIGPETNTILMGNHGSVNFADDLTIAYYRLEILDNYCKQLLLARQLGNVNVLNANQMTELLKVKEKFGFPDARIACSADGCIGTENQPFLTPFDVRPASASCSCNGGEVKTEKPNTATAASTGSVDNDAFEQMVQSITDQIMAAAR
ncbi:class II aldolase/adducin family protein [Phycisphaerales bacterium AB-hyl4]|uniref:Class II aldolase/adducin family protein n=1 Tax=Natronomicrosphaera hydrolytica TaxID=3242702 RepID=A0ABV4U850_9BACT